jgi:hypothetical protein
MEYTAEDVDKYYSSTLKPLYEEYIECTGQKIERVIERQALAFNSVFEKHFEEALGQLVTASITVGTALLTHFIQKAEAITKDKEKLKWCARAPKQQVRDKLESATSLHKKASALINTEENSVTSTIEDQKRIARCFIDAKTAYQEWLEYFDPELLSDFPMFTLKFHAKSQAVAFVGGVVASTLVTWAFLPPRDSAGGNASAATNSQQSQASSPGVAASR